MTAGDPRAANGGASSAGRVWLLAVAAVFPLAAILIVLQQGQNAWQLRLGDSDNYMRLVQVRDLLAGQGWFDLVQHRVNPPEGLPTHWSRLADLPYALPILLLRPLLGAELAERVTLFAVPPLLLLLTMISSAALANRLAGWKAAVCACLLLAVSTHVLAQFVPGRIDHHGLQILLLVGAVLAAVGSEKPLAGWICALLCVVSLAVGLETAPYLVLIAAWMAGRWVLRGDEARPRAMGFFLGLAVLAPPLAALAPGELTATQYDAFSGGHVAVIVVGALAWAGAMLVPGGERARVRMLAAAGAAAAGLAAAAAFPGLLVAPYSDVDPVLRSLWIDNLGETTSFLDLWRRSPPLAVAQIWFVAAATVTAFLLAARSRDGRRDRFVLLGCLGLVGTGLTFWQTRSDAAAASVAVPVAASALALLWDAWQRGKASVLPFAAAALLLNPIIVFALLNVVGSRTSGDAARRAFAARDRCDREADFAPLARQPRGLVLNPIDQSATLLARTPHAVVTAANHRNGDANGRAYRAFAAPAAAAERLVRESRADYVVFCRGAPEVANISAIAPRGLLASLRSGQVPPWLEAVPGGRPDGLVVLKTNWAGDDR